MTKSELPLPWAQLRQLMLKRQQLGSALSGRAGVLAVIEQLGYVQIDSVHVVERAHHHVLFDRVRDYQASWLDDLLEQRQIFEYWAHAAAYLPMRDIDGQYAVLQGGGWAAVVLPQITSMLASKRWTLDARRGSIFVEP